MYTPPFSDICWVERDRSAVCFPHVDLFPLSILAVRCCVQGPVMGADMPLLSPHWFNAAPLALSASVLYFSGIASSYTFMRSIYILCQNCINLIILFPVPPLHKSQSNKCRLQIYVLMPSRAPFEKTQMNSFDTTSSPRAGGINEVSSEVGAHYI